jgi:hypothetical protein
MTKMTQDKFRKAVEGSGGIMTVIAKKLGVNRQYLYVWLDKNPKLRAYIDEEMDKLLDFAEVKLYEEINKDNLRAIIFFLSTRGRKRGYGKQESFGSDPTRDIHYTFEVIEPKEPDV